MQPVAPPDRPSPTSIPMGNFHNSWTLHPLLTLGFLTWKSATKTSGATTESDLWGQTAWGTGKVQTAPDWIELHSKVRDIHMNTSFAAHFKIQLLHSFICSLLGFPKITCCSFKLVNLSSVQCIYILSLKIHYWKKHIFSETTWQT